MATELTTSLGFTVAVEDGEPATFDSAGYEDVSMVYDEVSGVTSVDGDLGDTYSVQTAVELKTGITKSAKGSRSFSPLTIMILDGVESTGRTTLDSAIASQTGQVSLKLTDADGDKVYLCGIVTTDTKSIGDADTIGMKSYSFQPNYARVEVAA
jgi:hypothetical protein